jgi:hypothetical protein
MAWNFQRNANGAFEIGPAIRYPAQGLVVIRKRVEIAALGVEIDDESRGALRVSFLRLAHKAAQLVKECRLVKRKLVAGHGKAGRGLRHLAGDFEPLLRDLGQRPRLLGSGGLDLAFFSIPYRQGDAGAEGEDLLVLEILDTRTDGKIGQVAHARQTQVQTRFFRFDGKSLKRGIARHCQTDEVADLAARSEIFQRTGNSQRRGRRTAHERIERDSCRRDTSLGLAQRGLCRDQVRFAFDRLKVAGLSALGTLLR